MLRWGRVVFLLASLLTAAPAAAADRVALVIGNSAYLHSGKLANPRNDAADISVALKKLGLKVIEGFDLDKAAFDRKVRDFASALQGAEAGVFFFAGHGLQVGGQNYLVPVDAELKTASALDFEMVRVDVVQRVMETETTTNILFLDACRDNPLARNLARAMGTRSSEIGRGFAPVVSGVGTLISFSTQPGNVALDGTGRNSPFAHALVKQLSTPKEDLSAILIDVRNDVMKETQNKQVPWEHSALRGRFYFNTAPPGPTIPIAPPPQQLDAEMQLLKEQLAKLQNDLKQQHEKMGAPADKLPQMSVPIVVAKPAAQIASAQPGTVFRDCPDCPEMVVVPGGTFTMGSPESEPERERLQRGTESPQLKVTIATKLAVGKFAVTFDEWDACVTGGGCNGYRPGDQGWGRGKRPVIAVNWEDAKAYTSWLSRKTGKSYRLLSDAEREYVARAGTTTPFWWGTSIAPTQANYDGSLAPYRGGGSKGESRQRTVPVDSFAANPWGLYNVHGNVWEWVEDCWNDGHAGNPGNGSARTSGDCNRHVLRGGSWNDYPDDLRAAVRFKNITVSRVNVFGFRVAVTLD